MNKKRPITCGIKNCRDSGLFKGRSPHKLLRSLTGHRPQSATFHTANPLYAIQKNDHNES
jgi:hypothetical protein